MNGLVANPHPLHLVYTILFVLALVCFASLAYFRPFRTSYQRTTIVLPQVAQRSGDEGASAHSHQSTTDSIETA